MNNNSDWIDPRELVLVLSLCLRWRECFPPKRLLIILMTPRIWCGFVFHFSNMGDDAAQRHDGSTCTLQQGSRNASAAGPAVRVGA